MKYKTLFRLLLKAIGVYLFAHGFSFSAILSLWCLWQLRTSGFMPQDFGISVATPAFMMGIGLYLFFGGEWVVNKAIPSNRPYCPECGYDLTGASGGRCTECGTPFKYEDVQPPDQAEQTDETV